MLNSIITNYNENIRSLDMMFSEISLEADTLIDDSQNKERNGAKFLNRIKQIIEKINAMIEKSLLYVKNVFQKVLLTDKGFKTEVRDAEVNRKPINGIKLITYSYTPEILDIANTKFRTLLTDIISSIDTNTSNENNAPLLMSPDDFKKHIFKKIGAPDNINDMDIYFKYLREKFRGKKSEKTIMATTLPQHIKIAESYDKVSHSINRDLAFFKSKINNANSSLKVASKNPNISDEDKRKLTGKLHNVAHIYAMYSSFCRIYIELKVEHMLSSRIIVKRLYQL